MVEPELDSSEFMRALKAEEPSAQARFVRETMGRMLAVAERVLANRADAEEAVQEAYLSAFKALASFDSRSSIRTWMHRIVVNAALMRLRKKSARNEISIEDLSAKFQDSGMHVEAPVALPDPSDSPEKAVMLQRDVRQALHKLPDEHRAIVILSDVEGYDSREIAELLHLSHDAARQRLHRARQALTKMISRDYKEVTW